MFNELTLIRTRYPKPDDLRKTLSRKSPEWQQQSKGMFTSAKKNK